jgi:hypothetical protein
MKFRDVAVYVQPECPGLPLFECDRAVREAAIELFSRADLWRAEPTDLRLVPNVSEYELPVPTGAEISRVLDVQLVGVPLKKEPSESAIHSMLARIQPATPTHFYQRDNEAIIVAPLAATATTVKLFASLKPTSTGTTIPDGVGKEYRNLLAIGAKAFLMLMAAQPWSNPQLGAMNKQLFERGVSAAIRRVNFGFNGAPLRVRPRPFI